MRTFVITIFIIFFAICSSFSQQYKPLLFRVLDANTKKAVPYATVRFAANKNGVIANVLGDFKIPRRYQTERDSLIISCIGYNTMRFALYPLTKKKYHTLYLVPKIEALSEVFLSSKKKKRELSARQIVKRAVKSIKQNNPTEPFSYIGYYRDYQFIDEKYVNLNEGITEVFDQGFQTNKIMDSLNNSAFYSYKLNTEFTEDMYLRNTIYNNSKHVTDAKMGSTIQNELTILNVHNPIRNFDVKSFSFVYILEKSFIQNHIFRKKKNVFLDNEELYKIEFSAKTYLLGPEENDFVVSGTTYISKEDFAIHKFNYNVYSNYSKKKVFNLSIEYKRQENDKMYLNYITFNNDFFVTENNVIDVENWIYDPEKHTFLMKFNVDLKPSSIENYDNLTIFYKNKKLFIKTMEFDQVDRSIVLIQFTRDTAEFLNQQDLETASDFIDIKMAPQKFVWDNSFMTDSGEIQGFQFRELFVQRVFLDKPYDPNLFYMDKAAKLLDAPINEFDISDYWLNSPLKTPDN